MPSFPSSLSQSSFRWLLLIGLFFLFLGYTVLGNSWYDPSELVLQGRTLQKDATLLIRWNSGQGFNTYEQRTFPLTLRRSEGEMTSQISFGATGKRSSASLSNEVVCTALLVDGVPFDLSTLAAHGHGRYADGELYFQGNQQVSVIVSATSHIGIKFRTNNHSGIAFTHVYGERKERNLYIANEAAKCKQFDYWLLGSDGAFSVQMALPRYPVHALQILSSSSDKPVSLTSAEIHGKGKVVDLLKGQQPVLGKIHFTNVLHEMRSFFHPVQFCWQVLFSLLSVWLVAALLQTVRRLGGLTACFLDEKRYVFWAMFGTSLAVFGLWLAAFWPGVMSVDSLKIWRAAMLPDVFVNDHPFMNVILYKYLYHIWGNPVIVPLTQVLCTALLISWFGFWLYRQGVQRVQRVLLACWFLFILGSVPIALYNLMLWKDIPFALLVVFWGCLLIKFSRERQQGRLRWTGQRVVSLILLSLFLAFIRHNGLVYLFILPILFLLLGLVPVKKVLIALVACMLVTGFAFTALYSVGKIADTGFFTQKISGYTKQLSVKNIASDAERTLHNYMTVLNINQTAQKWDKFHYYFHDRYAWWFLLHAGWWDLYPYQQEAVTFPRLRKAAMLVYEKSYQEPWVWLSWNPVWLLGLLPIFTLLFWWFPNTATLGVMLLAGSLPLVYLRIFNWRYYYFLYLGLLFLPALVGLDCTRKGRI
ncbi:MAG: hypothetical protein D3911_08580 [Candidatus Electrothrix sp. AW3_4]|nr:hypothetical protein [Candidatus Electrothrix gigas]